MKPEDGLFHAAGQLMAHGLARCTKEANSAFYIIDEVLASFVALFSIVSFAHAIAAFGHGCHRRVP